MRIAGCVYWCGDVCVWDVAVDGRIVDGGTITAYHVCGASAWRAACAAVEAAVSRLAG